MKLLIVESRTQTDQWDRVAQLLMLRNDVEIHWISVCRAVLPKNGFLHHIPLPAKSNLSNSDLDDQDMIDVRNSDRVVKYYGGVASHYRYYWSALAKELDLINPDVVVGELANFHTHMLQRLCLKRRIPFYQPSTTRYPSGRFGFYCEDRPQLLSGFSRKVVCDIDSIVNAIKFGRTMPDYMRKPSRFAWVKHKADKYAFKANLFRQFLRGDKYNIPHPRRAIEAQTSTKRRLTRWRSLSVPLDSLAGRKILLYPMQMQPEFNLDVWGRRFNQQYDLIRRIVDRLPEGWTLAIKINPKAYLEISDELLALQSPALAFLPVEQLMRPLLDRVDAIVSVTGTVAIEAKAYGKPCFVLSDGDFSQYLTHARISDLNDFSRIDELVALPSMTRDLSHYLKFVMENSFEGVIGERITNPSAISGENIENLYVGFDALLRLHEKNRHL